MTPTRHRLFTITNSKTLRGEQTGVRTLILHLAPFTTAGAQNLCPKSTLGCQQSCLYTAGRNRMPSNQAAKIRRTRAYLADRPAFLTKLVEEIAWYERQATREGLSLAVRPNGTSDLPGLARALARRCPTIQFYDYTKILPAIAAGAPLTNLHYTFSRSERNEDECVQALDSGTNVAVVYGTKKGGALPMFHGDYAPDSRLAAYPVVSGDETDVRFRDPRGTDGRGIIIGLRAKGAARLDRTGFVVWA